MRGVHGDLLIGGMVLRDLFGVIDEESNRPTGENPRVWTGRFEISPSNRSSLQLGRPYRLILEDGRSGQVVVRDMQDDPEEERVLLDLEALSSLE